MNALVRHLTLWELRRTLRGGTFRFMAAGYLLIPAVVLGALPRGPKALLGLITAQEIMLFLLLAFWTVGTVRRMISDRVSDDWLLFLRYRDFLLSKYAAAFALGSLLVLAGSPLELVALTFPGIGWGNVAPVLLVLWISVLIPITVATFIGAAQDALLRHIAVVGMAVLGTGVMVYGLPLACNGLSAFATLFNATGLDVAPTVFRMAGEPYAGIPWPLALLIQIVVLGVVWAWSWAKSEDFWQYPGLAEKPLLRPRNANLAEVRQAVGGSASTQPTPNRDERFAWRQALRRRHDDPVYVYDLAARQRWLGDTAVLWARWRQFVGFLKRFWWLVGLLIGGALWYFWPNLLGVVDYVRFGPDGPPHGLLSIMDLFARSPTYFRYLQEPLVHAWLVLAFGFLAAVVLAGSEIVAADRERGTLAAILLTKMSGEDLLRSKVHVILSRCGLYGAVLLGALGLLALLNCRVAPWMILAAPLLIAYVITYTVLAVLVSAASRTTLMAFFNGLLLLIAPTVALMLCAVSVPALASCPVWQALSPFLSLIAVTRLGGNPDEVLFILFGSVVWHLAWAGLAWKRGGRDFTRLLLWWEEM